MASPLLVFLHALAVTDLCEVAWNKHSMLSEVLSLEQACDCAGLRASCQAHSVLTRGRLPASGAAGAAALRQQPVHNLQETAGAAPWTLVPPVAGAAAATESWTHWVRLIGLRPLSRTACCQGSAYLTLLKKRTAVYCSALFEQLSPGTISCALQHVVCCADATADSLQQSRLRDRRRTSSRRFAVDSYDGRQGEIRESLSVLLLSA